MAERSDEAPSRQHVESPDTVHGRLLESVHITGYTFERVVDELRWLLTDDRWLELSSGYEQVSDFVRGLGLDKLRVAVDQRRELVELLNSAGASQRAIAEGIGVSHTTIQNDLDDGGNNLPPSDPDAPNDGIDRDSLDDGGNNLPPDEPKEAQEPDSGTPDAPPIADATPVEPEWFQQDDVDPVKLAKSKVERRRRDAENLHIGDEWYTPRWLFDALGLTFSIDVCAPVDRTHSAVPAEEAYDVTTDGLAQEWHGTVWCNPPYSTPDPWARRCIEHGNGLLLAHMPMNAGWCVDVWRNCDGIRLFQGIEFVRPDGSSQRPGYWLQLAAFGEVAAKALARLEAPPDVAANPRRVPSPMWVPA